MSTSDGVLVARHGDRASALRPDVARPPRVRRPPNHETIDGSPGHWLVDRDFTWKELRALRAEERLPLVDPTTRRTTARSDPDLRRGPIKLRPRRAERGRLPRDEAPDLLRLGRPLTRGAARRGSRKRHWDDADDPVIIQSFETANLRTSTRWSTCRSPSSSTRAAGRTTCRGRRPPHLPRPGHPGGPRRDRDLRRRHRGQQGPRSPRTGGATTVPSAVVGDAHAAGLMVHVWTLRRENQFMADELPGSAPTRTPRVTSRARPVRSSTRGWTGSSPTTLTWSPP